MVDLEKRPEIRCSQIKNKLKALSLFDEPVRDQVLKKISKKTLAIIEESKGDQWIPLELNIEISECAFAVMGKTGMYDWCAKAFLLSIGSPLVGSIFRSALNIFRVSPGALLKRPSQIWAQIYRNCGELSTFKDGLYSLKIVIQDLPPMLVGSRAYLIGIAGSFYAVVAFAGYKGYSELEQLSKTTASFIVSWEPK
jgi:hypothetical protein